MGALSGNGKGDQPAAPDFNQAAEAQARSSQNSVDQQTTANRANQTNAFGAQSGWSRGPNGQWTQSSQFGGPLGGAVGGLEGQVAANAGQPAMTGDQARDQAINGAYSQATSRLDPQWSQREQSTRAQLSAQGLDADSQAYQNQMGNLGRERNDAYSSAMNGAIGQGTAAGSAVFQQNQAAQMQPYQQLMALQGLSGQSQTPYAGQAQGAQYLSGAQAQYQGAQNQYATNQGSKNSTMGGLGSLAGSAVGALSDERLKTNIHRMLLDAVPGVPFARWEWKDRPGEFGFGVIAQDLQKVAPAYVTEGPDGFLRVNYKFLEDFHAQ